MSYSSLTSQTQKNERVSEKMSVARETRVTVHTLYIHIFKYTYIHAHDINGTPPLPWRLSSER